MASLQEQIAAAKAAKAAAEASFTEAHQKAEEGRAELDELNASTAATLTRVRAVVMADGLEAARERMGARANLLSYDAEAKCPGVGVFILRGPPKAAVNKLQGTMAKQKLSEVERAKANEDFAVECIEEWCPEPHKLPLKWIQMNGDDMEAVGDAKTKLCEHFATYGLLPTSMTTVGTELAGLDLAGAKS